MSTRYEFFDASRTSAEAWDRAEVEENTGEDLDDNQFGLVLGGDEVSVVVGTREQLQAFVAKLAALVADPEPVLPELTPPAGEEVDATCPYVFTQADVDAQKQRNREDNEVRRGLHGGAAYVVDVDTYSVPTVGDVCGESLTLWENVIDARSAYAWDDGHLVIGDSSLGDGEAESLRCSGGHQWVIPDDLYYA